MPVYFRVGEKDKSLRDSRVHDVIKKYNSNFYNALRGLGKPEGEDTLWGGAFGSFSEVFRTDQHIVYHLSDHSREERFAYAGYEKTSDCADAARTFLERNGFEVLQFDLEKLVDGLS